MTKQKRNDLIFLEQFEYEYVPVVFIFTPDAKNILVCCSTINSIHLFTGYEDNKLAIF